MQEIMYVTNKPQELRIENTITSYGVLQKLYV